MANRYWVGGTNTWNATAGTKWALTSGGVGGQAIPTSSDDVYFDGASGNVTITLSASINSYNLNFTGFTGTIAGTAQINIYGSLVLSPSMTLTHTGIKYFRGTGIHTITSNGKILSACSFVGTGTYTLLDDLNVSGALVLEKGTLDADIFNVSCYNFSSASGEIRVLYMGSGLWTITGRTGVCWNINYSNITLHKETANIKFTGNSTGTIGFWGYGLEYNELSIETTGTHSFDINNSNTFSNLKINAGRSVNFYDNTTQTVSNFEAIGTNLGIIYLDKIMQGYNVGQILTISVINGGVNYSYFDALTIENGNTEVFYVDYVDESGAILFFQIGSGGENFTAGTEHNLIGGTGSGARIKIDSVYVSNGWTISDLSGENIVRYCSISNSNATGVAKWIAPLPFGNINGGNNTGWSFPSFIYRKIKKSDTVFSEKIKSLTNWTRKVKS